MSERITGHTELIGLIAYPIRHSSSPKMHNEAFAKLGLDYAYLAFEVDNDTLEDTVKGFRAMKVRGWNVSMPNKTVIGKYLDKLTPAAEMCGAVNTVVNDNGVLTGTITDGIGYMKGLKDAGIDAIGKKMTIAGAGGAATAIEIQAALDGVAELSIFNRKDKFWANAEETVEKINKNTNCKAKLFDLDDKEALRKEIETSYILTSTALQEVHPDHFIVKRNDQNEQLDFDYGFVCLGMRSYSPLMKDLTDAFEDKDVEIVNIGDSVRARRIIDGTAEGRNILNTLKTKGYLE